MSEIDKSLNCSFCGKYANEVKKLIAGSNVYICDECVDLCYGILKEPQPKKEGGVALTEEDKSRIPSPRKIKDHLDQYIIGQDDAKTTIAVAVYNHYKRLENPIIDDVEIEKSNILMIGPTGSGKTLIAQSIAKMLDVPLAIADATSLTEAGYVGEDVESIITRLLQAANHDVKAAERGIIFIDEIDKKRGKTGGATGSRDVSGEGVQQALLKLLEGSEIMVPPASKKGPMSEMVRMSTKNILFIVGGAFVGLDKIITDAVNKNHSGVGFGAKTVGKIAHSHDELLSKVRPDHLVKFGLIPELIGRLPIYSTLNELTEDQLVKVLTEPKNALVKQFAKRFELDSVELEFTPEALIAIAKDAKERKTGARGLRSVIENSLTKLQFELPEMAERGVRKVTITENFVTKNESPIFEYEPVAEQS